MEQSKQARPPYFFAVDSDRREVLARGHGTNEIKSAVDGHQAEGRTVNVHNVTHPACPDWVRELALSDPEWRERRAAEHERTAENWRVKADDCTRKADEAQRLADELRAVRANPDGDCDGEPDIFAPS